LLSPVRPFLRSIEATPAAAKPRLRRLLTR
jgi:hypothetical protein